MDINVPSFINSINSQQDKYYVEKFMNKSRNIIYSGVKRVFRNEQDRNGEQNAGQTQNSESLVFKLQLILCQNDMDKYTRVHQILHLFSNDPRVIQNKKVIPIRGIFNRYLMIPTKYYLNGDAFDFVNKNTNGFDKEELFRIITFQALHILILLKNRGVVHNDFKFENLMITEDPVINGPQFPFYVLVFDFDDAQTVDKNGKSDIIGGTKVFNAPEVQLNQVHDYLADIWSLGANIYYLMTYVLPFGIDKDDSKDIIVNKMKNDELIHYEDLMSKEAYEVVDRMLKFRIEDRITPEKALKMRWFNGLDPVDPMFVSTINANTSDEE